MSNKCHPHPRLLLDVLEELRSWLVTLCFIGVVGVFGWFGYGLLDAASENMTLEASAVQNLVPIELDDRNDGRIAMVEPNTGRLYMVPITAINPE